MTSKLGEGVLLTWVLAICAGCATAPAPGVWRGDFETGDLSQWSYLVNPQGLELEGECVYEGRYAGRVQIHGNADMLWRGNKNLNRTEFNYKPAAGRIGEGQDTFFGWSFYLPQPLTEKKHESGYWESEKTYQQMFRFNLQGTALSFQETKRAEVFWSKENFATPGVWHDVALHIHWSTNAQQGFVKVWLDGEEIGENYFKTLHAVDEGMFTQIGFLRARQDAIETMLIDNVRDEKNINALLAGFNPDKKISCQR